MSHALGKSAGYEAIQLRQPLAPLLDAVVKSWHTPAGSSMLSGLLEVLCEVLDACQRSELRFDWKSEQAQQIADAPPTGRRLLLYAACQHQTQATADLLAALSAAVFSVREKITLSFPKQDDQPAEAVTLVKIVGMPERVSSTEVARVNDAIVGSTSIEQDR